MPETKKTKKKIAKGKKAKDRRETAQVSESIGRRRNAKNNGKRGHRRVTHRINCDFSHEAFETLTHTMHITGSATQAEVLRKALALYAKVAEAHLRGASFGFREASGEITWYMLPY